MKKQFKKNKNVHGVNIYFVFQVNDTQKLVCSHEIYTYECSIVIIKWKDMQKVYYTCYKIYTTLLRLL